MAFHRAQKILFRHPLRKFRSIGAFIAALPIDKRKMTFKNSSLRRREQIPNLFIVPLPIFVGRRTKAAAGIVCAVGNCVPNKEKEAFIY
jgi:hypothetical protein